MTDQGSERRTFLKQAGVGLAAPLMAQLFGIRRAVAEELSQPQADDVPTMFARLRELYLLDPEVTYLNHASIGTIPRAVQVARQRYLELCETNPWLHMWGGAWEEPREEVRRKAARLLRCTPEEITFSHNTTETFNLLAGGVAPGPRRRGPDELAQPCRGERVLGTRGRDPRFSRPPL